MELSSILLSTAKSAILNQQSNGAMPGGLNGPYQDPETPVRNTSHWLISFLKSYQLTGEKNFLIAAERCLVFLMSKEARPMDASYWHRKNPKKDFSNGLIGQAWTFEALEFAYRYFGDERILKCAELVFKLHPYDSKQKGWKTINVDGSVRGFDPTFNHQLWFAAIGLRLSTHGDKEIEDQAKDFLNDLENQIKVYRDGVIMHHPFGYLRPDFMRRAWDRLSYLKADQNYKRSIYSKSVGYHGFNLYALAMVRDLLPNHPFFTSKIFARMIQVIQNKLFIDNIDKSIYSFDYNPPGFELACAEQKFGNPDNAVFWLKKDFEKSFDQSTQIWGNLNKFDPNTAMARVYEVYMIDDMNLLV